MAQTIRISIRVEKEDKQAIINCITALPTGIKLSSHRELKKTYRFTFLVTRYQLLNKLFASIRKKVKNKYSFMPRNKKKLLPDIKPNKNAREKHDGENQVGVDTGQPTVHNGG